MTIPEPIGSTTRAVLSQGDGSKRRRADRYPKTSPEHIIPQLTPAELREWLKLLALSPRDVARALGRSEASVYMWLAGEHPVPVYVTVWVELLAAYDRNIRAWMSESTMATRVFEFIRAQPAGSKCTPEMVARRLGWPLPVVREVMAKMESEGMLG